MHEARVAPAEAEKNVTTHRAGDADERLHEPDVFPVGNFGNHGALVNALEVIHERHRDGADSRMIERLDRTGQRVGFDEDGVVIDPRENRRTSATGGDVASLRRADPRPKLLDDHGRE